MKKPIVSFLLVLVAVSVRAALPQPDLVAQIYFAGEQKIFTAPNVGAFTNEFCSAPALALRQQTANKLAPWLATFLQSHTGAGTQDGAARLRPLLDDLQTAEWMVEARAPGNGPVELGLAIRLSNDRAQAWAAALKPFFPAATFSMSGGWLIFDSGTGSPKLGNEVAQKAAGPHNGWFSLDVNWPRLAQWYPELGQLGLPETQFTVTAPDKDFRINGTFYYPQPLALNLTPWQFPTNLVHQPLVSFTAIRGFGSWYRSQAWAQPYQIAPTPNQVYFWALQGMSYQTFFAVPEENPMDALNQVYERLSTLLRGNGTSSPPVYSFSLQKTNDLMMISDVPFAAPFIKAVNGPSGGYLLGGAFANTFKSKPLPPELFTALKTPNIVCYHWENTAERVPTMLEISQLGLMETHHVQLGGESAAYKWLMFIAPHLGNTVTEIKQTAPDQLSFLRETPGIFTSLEFYALANWLEAKNFPGCDLRMPNMAERAKLLLKKHQTKTEPIPSK